MAVELIQKPRTIQEWFEVIKMGIDGILPLMDMHGVEKLLSEGDIEMARKVVQKYNDEIAALKLIKADVEKENLASREKAQSEIAKIYQSVNDVRKEAYKMLEDVKGFVSENEKRRFHELQSKSKKELAAA